MAKFALRRFDKIRAFKRVLRNVFPHRVFETLIFRMVRSWTFQGALYLSWRELLFRLTLELFTISVFWIFFRFLLQPFSALAVSMLLSHTMMWLLNGHFWAISLKEGRRVAVNRPEEVLKYMRELHGRTTRTRAVKACVIFGSLSRGQFSANSDLDVWCVSRAGLINHIIAFSFGVRERAIALFARMPIELYFYELLQFAGTDSEERPILIKDEDGTLVGLLSEALSYGSYPFDQQEFFSKSSVSK